MSDLIWGLTLAAMGLIVLVRLPTVRGSVRQRAGTGCLLAITLSAAASMPHVRGLLDGITRVPDVWIPLSHAFAVLAVVCALELAATYADADARADRLLRRTELALASALCVMAVLFVVIPRHPAQPDFGLWEAQNPRVIAYQILFQSCLGVGLSTAALLLSRGLRSVGRHQPLRTALLLLVSGSISGLAYIVCRLWYIVTHGLGVETVIAGPVYGAVTVAFLLGCILLLGVGSALPPTLRVVRLVQRYLAYQRLRGLWRVLTDAVPDVVLVPPLPLVRDLLAVRSVQLLLYRRMVEIRDAQLELTGYVAGSTRNRLHHLLSERRDVVDSSGRALDACVLALGLCLKEQGAIPSGSRTGPTWSGDASYDDELADLLAIRRLLRSRVVLDTVAAVTTADRPQPAV